MSAVELSPDQLEALAEKIADKLAARATGELIDTTELAKRIGRSRDWVYGNARGSDSAGRPCSTDWTR
jgi:hypothetical protein